MQELDLAAVKEIGLEILHDVDGIFSAAGIKYTIDFGTLLGARRHGGYIPWDDDIDISVSPQSFRFILQNAEKMLPKHLKIRPNHSLQSTVKIADVRFEIRARLPFAPGGSVIENLGIDIFTLQAYRKSARILPTKTAGRITALSPTAKDRSDSFRGTRPLRALALRGIAALPRAAGDFCGAIVQSAESIDWELPRGNPVFGHGLGSGFGPEFLSYRTLFPLEEIGFEGGMFPGPHKVDTYLSALYGDWRRLPRDEEQFPSHFLGGWRVP